MTYDTDPTRWTDAPHSAPDSLRDAFAAARNEGPSDLQMRALALKLAAMSGGAALAASSSAAHASSTGAAVASSGGALSLGKIALSVVMVSAVAAGTALYRTSTPSLPASSERAPAAAIEPSTPEVAQPTEASRQGRARAIVREERSSPSARTPEAAATDLEVELAKEGVTKEEAQAASASERQPTSASEPSPRAQPRTVAQQRERAARKARAAVESRVVEERSAAEREETAAKPRDRSAVVGELKTPEIQLLRRARENLDARPHEAFRLTEQHRREYPNGVFGQERDALAIEALLRAGDVGKARARAEDFVDTYPSSPHAHRFRETMKLGD